MVVAKKEWGTLGLTVENSKRGAGVIVSKMEAGSILEACGLNIGDCILTVGKVLVTDHSTTIAAIDSHGPSDELIMTMAVSTRVVRVDKTKGAVGLSLANMPSGVGVSVCGLSDNSTAADKLNINDEILSVNGVPTNHHADAIEIIDKAARFVDIVIVGDDYTTQNVKGVILMKGDGAWADQLVCEPQPDKKGVKVVSVTDGSSAAAAGISAGAVIYSINNRPVTSDEDCKIMFQAAAKSAYVVMPVA